MNGTSVMLEHRQLDPKHVGFTLESAQEAGQEPNGMARRDAKEYM